jgi:hypothetical protein
MAFQLPSNNLISEIESLRNAEVYSVYQKIRGHREALRFVKVNYLPIKRHFDHFTEIYNSPEFWGNDATMRVKFKRKATHLLFNYLCSVAAIVDLSRRIKEILTEEAQKRYQDIVDKKFVEDGSNNFIRQLRNFVSHYDVLFVGVQAKIIPPPSSAHWTVQKKDLENYGSWTGSGKIFLKSQSETIDFFPLLQKYHEDFILVQDALYCEVLSLHNHELQSFVGQNHQIALQCQENRIWPGPPLGFAKIRHLNWLLSKPIIKS